jgi:hypothetical protein
MQCQVVKWVSGHERLKSCLVFQVSSDYHGLSLVPFPLLFLRFSTLHSAGFTSAVNQSKNSDESDAK